MQVITLLFIFLTHHLYPHPHSTLELNEIFAEKDLLHFRTFGYGHSFGTLSHYVRPAHSSTPRQHTYHPYPKPNPNRYSKRIP
jgi:hypothetical protein